MTERQPLTAGQIVEGLHPHAQINERGYSPQAEACLFTGLMLLRRFMLPVAGTLLAAGVTGYALNRWYSRSE